MLYEQANEDRRRLGCLVKSDRSGNQCNPTELASLRLSNLKCNQAVLIARFVYCDALFGNGFGKAHEALGIVSPKNELGNIRVLDLRMSKAVKCLVSSLFYLLPILFGVHIQAELPDGNYNVVMIFVDDLKPKIESFGAVEMQTPHLDSFASTGVRFTKAYCQQAVCGPSRASILSGLRPDTSGIWENPVGGDTTRSLLGNEYVTLPQAFGNNAFTTYGLGKIYHGATQASQDRTMSYTDGWESHGAANSFYEGTESGGKWADEDAGDNRPSATDMGSFDYRVNPPETVTDTHYRDGLLAEKAVAKLAEYSNAYLNSEQQFFLAIGFSKPHLPFACPKSYWDLYDPDEIDLVGYDGTYDLPTGGMEFTAPPLRELTGYTDIDDTPNATEARHLIHGYMACVSYVDAQVGKVISALDTLDPSGALADNTIVVVTGDHGWHLADHGAFWTKNTNFEEATRAPLIIRAPGMESESVAGSDCSKPIELINVFPTLLDLAGLEMPVQPNEKSLEGVSLRPLLENPAGDSWGRPAFSQFHKRIQGDGLTTGWGMGYTMRTERYRYTEWYLTDEVHRSVKTNETPELVELYDHEIDSEESANLAYKSGYEEIVTALASQLDGGRGWSASFEVDGPTVVDGLAIERSGENLRLKISGDPGETWAIHYSENLISWNDLEGGDPVVLDEEGLRVLELGDALLPRFYRASPVELVGNGLPAPFHLFPENMTLYVDGDFMVIESTNVPNHPSPYFQQSDDRYEAYNGINSQYRRHPTNEIVAQNWVYRIPLNPSEATNKESTALGSIGVAINGVAFFNQYAAGNRPLTGEVNSFDQYNGHPTGTDAYHYHFEPLYLTGLEGKDGLIGVLLDGFPVYGPNESGNPVTNDDLDEFHGHFHATDEFPDGIYHYHFTEADPYLNGGEYFGVPGTRTN